MKLDKEEMRNFLMFLNEAQKPKFEDSLIGGLATPSSWEVVADRINESRQNNTFVQSIKTAHLYVHVPFCAKICSYCDCSKVLLQRSTDIDTYVKSLIQQIPLQAAPYKGLDAESISMGGGTPSILNEQQFTAIFDTFDDVMPTKNRKIHIELHPSSWTESKLALLADRGLYRVSIGVQSMEGNALQQASRIQSREKVLWCIRSARKAKVRNINVDLIAGLKGQTIDGFLEDLKLMISEGVNNIHAQPLTGERIKDLCAPGESIPDFNKRRDAMMKEALVILKEAGFRHKIPDGWYRDQGRDYMEEAYVYLKAAIIAFGPFAKGQFPGSVFYRAGNARSVADFSKVDVAFQDVEYVMSHCAAIDVFFDGLDEKAFLKRFGVSVDQHCGEGFRFLQEFGLVENVKGVWQFAGKWEFSRVRELYGMLRILYGEKMLSKLREQYALSYDPKKDYRNGQAYIESFAYNPLMGLYYSR